MRRQIRLIFTAAKATGICCLLFACAQAGPGRTPDGPGAALLRFYQEDLDHLSAVRWAECPMYPSCSVYAARCLEKHGFFVGWMMIADRLMRCGGDETRLAPKVYVDGAWKTYDPVDGNDFWWACPNKGLKGGDTVPCAGPVFRSTRSIGPRDNE